MCNNAGSGRMSCKERCLAGNARKYFFTMWRKHIMNRNLRSIISVVLCLVMVATMFVGCVKDGGVVEADLKQAEYNTTTSVMPSNWNEFTYADNNDTQIMSYIGSSFFEYDYKFENDEKFNKDGTINKAGIVPGAYTTNYSAATKLEDVTATVDAKWDPIWLPCFP